MKQFNITQNSVTSGIAITGSVAFMTLCAYLKKSKKNKKIRNLTYVDDVTGMNETSVNMIIQPTCEQDILDSISTAKNEGRQLSVFGQKHTMGGHIVVRDGIVLDMNCYDKILQFDDDNMMISVQPGITWSKLIHFLDFHGLSPMILQSYSTFSVGGSIGANIHGITSDDALVKSIISFRLATSDSIIIECSEIKNEELFSLVIGGYGLFGIVTEVTLKVVPNSKLKMKTDNLSPTDFAQNYLSLVGDPWIGIKLGRININNWKNLTLFSFEKINIENYVSHVEMNARSMSKIMQLGYKWISDTSIGKNIRFGIERFTGKPLDWSMTCDTNGSLYESAIPMANLWSPIFDLNKTHILQEYFIPSNNIENLEKWICLVGNYFNESKFKHTSLLNATIRFVKHDDITFLNYAKEDMFAIVLYYRLNKLYEGDTELHEINEKLTNITHTFNGTFYLPYRHHYSIESLNKSYPQWADFVRLKRSYDPNGIFSNEWWKDYSAPINNIHSISNISIDTNVAPSIDENIMTYQNVFSNQIMSKHDIHKFHNFGKFVFPFVNPNQTLQFLQSDRSENEIYEDLINLKNSASFFTNLRRGLHVLNLQKNELVKETTELLKKVGKTEFNGFVAIGDCGRYVNGIRKNMKITGSIYVVHDNKSLTDIVERGSLFSVGKFIKINYNDVKIDFMKTIADESIELVTLYIGLHHFTQDNLNNFLKEVSRILKPNGIFVLRDHNATEDIKPLLCFAHTYFNALTGVDWETNINEVRNFMTVRQIRHKMEEYGFACHNFYEKQMHDPTENFLMAFVMKPIVPNEIRENLVISKTYNRSKSNGFHTIAEWSSVELFKQYGKFMEHTPYYMFPYLKSILTFWKLFYTQSKECAKRNGWIRTIIHDGFLMNMTLGGLLSLVFGQLSILSAPARWIYTMPMFADTKFQELILFTKDGNIDRSFVSEDVNVLAEWTAQNKQFYHIKLPRYMPFTAKIIEFSQDEQLEIYEISGNKNIQVNIIPLNNCESVDEIIRMSIQEFYIKITSVYKIPNLQNDIICEVPVKNLMKFIRFMKTNNFKVKHIFDY